MPLFPTAASGAWQPASPRSLPGTPDKTASGFDKRGGRGPWHPAPGRAIQEPLRIAAALRPHKKNTISSAGPPDRKSQNCGQTLSRRWTQSANAMIVDPAAMPMYCRPSTVYVIGPAFQLWPVLKCHKQLAVAARPPQRTRRCHRRKTPGRRPSPSGRSPECRRRYPESPKPSSRSGCRSPSETFRPHLARRAARAAAVK